ncbi:spindle and kinetochore-associated protein 1 isoform X2 [Syngnathoides biaculeatus]|uniref:spindle and kinetochore-associated protein 1 isoform X2 n=1 Tax=Syngnathoides biaculeatus TaxID=300417 RepID=UPI002ADD63AB|nr:spindle and kinetochore-associated protein 1 isoform X2 [Syngnathoides biaculeatus]
MRGTNPKKKTPTKKLKLPRHSQQQHQEKWATWRLSAVILRRRFLLSSAYWICQLQALEELFQNLKSLQHLKDNVPGHIPNICPNKENEPLTNQSTVTDVESTQHHTVKIKSYIREMEFITLTEFERIPRYMKGRLSYDQINKAVENINTAVVAKYNIFHQPLKTLNNHARKLYQRFKDQETKDTRGHYFVVEEDFRELAQMKVDKRLQVILNMLRHCQRLRELRGGGITRYILL